MATSIINGQETPAWQLAAKGISVVGSVKNYDTYADFLTDKSKGTLAYVKDATGDPSVKSGGALYRIVGTQIVKMYEEESMEAAEKIALVNGNIDLIFARLADIIAEQMNIVFVNDAQINCQVAKWYVPSAGGCKFILPETAVNGQLIKFTIFPDAVGSFNPDTGVCSGSQLIGTVNNHLNILLEDPCTIFLIYKDGWQILEKDSIDFVYIDHNA